MGRRSVRLLAAAAASGAALLLAGPAQAVMHPLATANNMYTTLLGVPEDLPVGGTMDLTVSMRWDSLLPIDVTGLGISMWSSVPDTPPAQGITVLWQDPKTGVWRGSDQVDAPEGFWGITEQGKGVAVLPGGTLTVQLRVTMNSSAAVGTETVNAGQFDFKSPGGGNELRGTTTSHNFQASFQFGGGGHGGYSGGGSTATATAGTAAPTGGVPTNTPAPPTATGTAPTTSLAAVPAAALGSAGGKPPTATGPSPVPPSRTAPPDTITEANIVLRGSASVSAFAAIVVLLAFLAGSALVIVRSRRAEAGAGKPPSHRSS